MGGGITVPATCGSALAPRDGRCYWGGHACSTRPGWGSDWAMFSALWRAREWALAPGKHGASCEKTPVR